MKAELLAYSEKDPNQLPGDRMRRVLVDDDGYLLVNAKGPEWEQAVSELGHVVEGLKEVLEAIKEITDR